jgi:hypothetical protein
VAYRLRHDQSVADGIKRIIMRQFELATTELRDIGDPRSDAAIHSARRRVKKVQAAILLARPTLGHKFRTLNKRLRRTIRLLAPVADGQGVVHALDELADRYRADFSPPVFETIRSGLIEREARVDRKAKVDRVLQTVTATIRREHARVKRWRLRGGGFAQLAPGLEMSFRRARTAMAAALRHPTADNHHRWRRRVKNHWFHVRLIEGRCGNRLAAYKRRLEALDECLGQYHNFALLHSILLADPFVSRQETARRLRLIRRYQAELRHHAKSLGGRLYDERPSHFVRRVRALWQLASLVGHPSSEKTSRRST